MKTADLKYLTLCLAKSTSSISRLYQKDTQISLQSVYQVHPDPIGPYLKEILAAEDPMSVYITPLCQFYGCIRMEDDFRLVFGPSRMKNNEESEIMKLLIDLNVPKEKQKEYRNFLQCAPEISLDRMSWNVVMLASALNRTSCSTQDVRINMHPQKLDHLIQESWEEDSQEADSETAATQDASYSFEQLIAGYVENGQLEQLKELLSSVPKASAGKMALDEIRQLKDTNICSAAVFSRAAIRGGMDSKAAFRLSDLYIQQTELLRDAVTLEKLNLDMIIDYASKVNELKCGGSNSPLVTGCAAYISEHIFEKIRAADIAQACGYSRCYLSTQFKKETGISQDAYIQREKIIEARHMLQFTEKPLCDISNALCFSSQSHFQSVFRAVTGMTPVQYRKTAN